MIKVYIKNLTLFPFQYTFEQIKIIRTVTGIKVNPHTFCKSNEKGDVSIKIGKIR